MKKYLINGKEVYPMCLAQPTHETFEIRIKFNKLLEALDQTPKEWRADSLKVGDIYWYVEDQKATVSTNFTHWQGDDADRFRLATNNVFQIKEQVKARIEEIMES